MPAMEATLKCCITGSIRSWNADTKKWTKSDGPALPGPVAFARGQTCLPIVPDNDAPDVQIILAHAEEVKRHTPCLAHLQSQLDIPHMWFTEYSRKSNGYFGSEILTDDKGEVSGVTTWCRFIVKTITSKDDAKKLEYMWDKLNMFTRWDAITGKTTIIFFLRLKFEVDVEEPFEPMSLFPDLAKSHLQDPFWVYSFALRDVAQKQNDSVWKVRTGVRLMEKKAEKHDKDPNVEQPGYRVLHDLARHTIHGTETLDAAVAVTESILQQHESLGEVLIPTIQQNTAQAKRIVRLTSHRKAHSSLSYHLSVFRTLLHRSTSNKERLLNEINLLFNKVAQSDASTSHDLAKAARLDSAAMKTIAFVTTAFLPATFIAAIFSTSFFNFEQGHGWAVSDRFWIYWICAVPITVVSVVVLNYWQKWFVNEGHENEVKRAPTWGKAKRRADIGMVVEDRAASDSTKDIQMGDIESGLPGGGLRR